MQSSTYVSRRPGPFAALMQAPDLGDFRLDPLSPVRVRDQYWDTTDGELLRGGLALRVRDVGGTLTVALRPLAGHDERVPDAPLGPDAVSGDALRLPPGPLADAVARRIADDPLRPLLALRQYRTPRIAYDGTRPAMLVSLDVVVYEVPGAQVVSNEVEVEVTAQGDDGDLGRADPHLRGYDLEPEGRTKLERGLLRVRRDLAEPILLLPDEREALERLAERGDAATRRRARVLLLDARGYRADTVAGQTGMSAARVRRVKERFQSERLALFYETTEAPTETPYRVHELVDAPADDDATDDAPPEAPLATDDEPSGDSAGDLDRLLDFFTPTRTTTPFLDEDTDDEDTDDEDTDDEDTDDEDTDDEVLGSNEPDDEALQDEAPANSDTEAPQDDADPDGSHEATASDESQNGADVSPTETPPSDAPPSDLRPLRRPVLTADTPLIDAAFSTLVYHVARFEEAAARLADADTGADDARRLLLAAHRVRLAVEAFGPFVPAMAAQRLVAALRPLVGALDRALDLDHAARASSDARLAERRDEALAQARRLLRGGRHRAWGPRATRLLDRLGAQHADGLLIGDDFPPPPDDLVGQPGDVPVPSRLCHAAASMLWARYEAVRAFDDDVRGMTAETVHHLALAVSGLHFVLGIAARASSDAAAARALSARLDAAEARLAAHRQALLRAEAGAAEAPNDATVQDVWGDLTSDDFRRAVADVVAAV